MKKYLELFLTFFKLGLFTFGGGYAMIPSLKEIVVEKKKWLSEEEMLEILAISESTPGPIAINMATFIGYRQKKVLGSVLSTLGVVLPSLIIIYIISLFFDAFLANQYVASAFIGIKACVALFIYDSEEERSFWMKDTLIPLDIIGIKACVAFLITKAGLDMLIKMKKKPFNLFIFSIVFILLIIFELLSINFSSLYFIILGGLINIFIVYLSNFKKKEVNE